MTERTGATGERFGAYTSLGPAADRVGGHKQVRLRCDCGREVVALLSHWRYRAPRACAKCTRKKSHFNPVPR